MHWSKVFGANPTRRFRNGWNDLGGGVRVWVSGDVPTSVVSTGLRGRALEKKISTWFGTPLYLSNKHYDGTGAYRADVSIDPLMRSNPQAKKTTVEKAVREMQLYLGSIDYAPVRAQEKLRKRVDRITQKIADQTGLIWPRVWEQIRDEARNRGVIRPMPGKDY